MAVYNIKTLSHKALFVVFNTELLTTELPFLVNKVIEVGLDLCDHMMLCLANK